MPTTYAHWRFGDRCINTLAAKYQEIIKKYRNEYDYGVHGPDVFFYYKVYKSNEINKYGTWMHDQPFYIHFEMFKRNLMKHDNKEAGLSYLLGFLSHFALDSYCHSYIEHKAEEEGPAHLRIEGQFDRYFLIRDGYNPIKKSATFSLKPSNVCCHNVAQMYDLDEEITSKAMSDQLLYLNILKDNSLPKRWALNKALTRVKASKFIDLLIGERNDPRCKVSNIRLDKYFQKALEHYPILAESLLTSLTSDKPLINYFNNTFSIKPNYKDIPLLKLKDELNYEVSFQQ